MRFFKDGEWKLFNPIYLAMFIGIAIPDIDMLIMVFFFAKGFTATQIGIGFALYSLFIILSEIPTGTIADKYGKRFSIQINFFIHSLIFISFFFITEAWMMWVLFSVMGISETFRSGAFDALPYEIAKHAKREDLINTFYSTYTFLVQVATAISNFAVIGFLFLVGATNEYIVFGQVHQGLNFLWLTGALGYLIAFFILFKINEKVKKHKLNIKKDLIQTYRNSLKAIQYTRKHPVLKKLIFFGIFSTITMLLFSDIVYQPFLLDLGFNPENIAITIAFASLLAAAFSQIPKLISNKFKTEKNYIQAMLLVKLIVLISLFFFAGPIYSIIFFFVYFATDSLIHPMVNPFKQFFYKKNMRATLGSVESTANNLVAVIIFPIIGYLIDTIGSNKTILIAAIPLFIAFLIFRSIKYENCLIH